MRPVVGPPDCACDQEWYKALINTSTTATKFVPALPSRVHEVIHDVSVAARLEVFFEEEFDLSLVIFNRMYLEHVLRHIMFI